MIRSAVAFALSVLRRIRAEAAKDTLAAVNAQLPMDVVFYLLNQKRKEIAQLEEEYNLTLNLVGNPLARQNEHTMEFVRRAAPHPRQGLRRLKEQRLRKARNPRLVRRLALRIDAAGAALVWKSRKHRHQNRQMRWLQPRCRPLSSTPRWRHPRLERVGGFSGGSIRGRGVWKVMATAKPPVAKAGARSGRQTAGRLARRARGWWRRRASSQAGQSDGAAKQEPAQVSEPVEAAQK